MGRFYLTTYVGAGTDTDPFRPSGVDLDGGGWSAIDLRPDPTKVDGRALLWTPDPLATAAGRVALTDDPDENSTALRGQIENRLGLNLDQAPFRRLVASLLLEHGDDANTKRWNRLRATRFRWEIWLGGLLWDRPVISGGATITESFNKADSTIVGPDLTWTEVAGAWAIVSNTLAPSSAGWTGARADSDLASTDHYAEVDVTTFTTGASNNGSAGIACRFSSSAFTAYIIRLLRAASNGNRESYLGKIVGGAYTALSGATATSVLPTFRLRIEAEGSTIRRKIDGSSIGDVTDTSITTGVRGGIIAHAAAGATIRYDNFAAGDLTAGATVTGTMVAALGGLAANIAGQRIVTGTIEGSLGGLSSSMIGQRTVVGALDATLGGLSAHLSGQRTVPGLITAPLGALTAHITGQRVTSGTMAASLGGMVAHADGQRTVVGTMLAALGGLTANMAGEAPAGTVEGTMAAALGGLDATMAGRRVVSGAATAALSGLVAHVSGTRVVLGTATAPLGGLSAAMAGTRIVDGAMVASLGGLVSHMVASAEGDPGLAECGIDKDYAECGVELSAYVDTGVESATMLTGVG